jgi:imidazole glycerol phosphate synthase glutamine amidotransferase subunit
MDTSDAKITFDARGWCEYCNNYRENILPHWHTDERGAREIEAQAEQIRTAGRGRDHDCLIGISGGVDSSYVTYIAKVRLGLRPLLFHVDAGWNSQQAVNNIERLVDGLRVDLHTEVIDWEEMKDLQLAFFRAQVPHIDTPQDHAFFAALYNFAAERGFRYILTGANYSTECVREPLEWHYHASDLRQLKDIHRRFGTRPLKTFPTADIFTYKLYYRFVKGVRVVKPLNYVPYFKEAAMQELVDRFGWQRYAHKHYESRFTRFYEGYWLPAKFGYDKRRAHFSSLILTGQMTREEALRRIAIPAYTDEELAQTGSLGSATARHHGGTQQELSRLQQCDGCHRPGYPRPAGAWRATGRDAVIHIVDYGLGNIRAFLNMYKRLGFEARTARAAGELQGASKLILPGVGAFDHAMQRLQASGMREALDELVLKAGVPVLGVCVGMQMLAMSSEEGVAAGLGWVDGRVRSLKGLPGAGLVPLPHMGWNDVLPSPGAKLFAPLGGPLRFYFLHSFYFECGRSGDVAATAEYGSQFCCAVESNNVFGVQFHPEKSHHFGAGLLKAFAEL